MSNNVKPAVKDKQKVDRAVQDWVQWSALDALALKWMAMQVESGLPPPARSHHLKGHWRQWVNLVCWDLVPTMDVLERGGRRDIHTSETGICLGSGLSLLIGVSLLRHIDHYFTTCKELFYARYMDDFIIFTKTRWHLSKGIKRLHECFDLGGFETHTDKTQMGRIEPCFN
jgi:hypothetical protein